MLLTSHFSGIVGVRISYQSLTNPLPLFFPTKTDHPLFLWFWWSHQLPDSVEYIHKLLVMLVVFIFQVVESLCQNPV